MFGTKNQKTMALLLTLVVVAASQGCSDHGDSVSLTNPVPEIDAISFAADIQPVFDAQCVGCHGLGGTADLDLRSGWSYGNLVGVEANESSGSLVVAGDAENSVLSRRMAGTMSGRMPPGGLLPASTVDLVSQWIQEGALDN